MRCFIPIPFEVGDNLYFYSVQEARTWLSDPKNIIESFDELGDDFLVELIWDKEYDEYEDWIPIDSWELRSIRMLHGLPLKKNELRTVMIPNPPRSQYAYRFVDFDNYDEYAKIDSELHPDRWKKAKRLKTIRFRRRSDGR